MVSGTIVADATNHQAGFGPYHARVPDKVTFRQVKVHVL